MLNFRELVLACLCFVLGTMALAYGADIALLSGVGGPSAPTWGYDGSAANRQLRVEVARSAGVDLDPRSRAEVVADFRKQQIAAVPSALLIDLMESEGTLHTRSPAIPTALLPLGGVANALTVFCNESGQFVTYTSDEHGFRNPPGIWTIARADLAAVGQSHVQGFCVEVGQSFVDRLRPRFPATLNIGNSGDASLLQLAGIREYLAPYQPRTVLWFFGEGLDLPDLYDELRQPFVRQYLDPGFSQRLLARQPELDEALRGYLSRKEQRDWERLTAPRRSLSMAERSLEILKLWELRGRLNLIFGRDAEFVNGQSMLDPPEHNVFARILGQAQSTIKTWGGTLYLVYLPSWGRYVDRLIPAERERTRVLGEMKALGISVIDLTPAFDQHGDPLSLFWFRRAVHYNDAGHRIIADTLLQHLTGS